MTARGRGRLSAIDLLPEEAEPIVALAAQQLADRDRSQLDIYAEFKNSLIALQGEQGIAFDIPSFSAFNRYSIKLSLISRRMERAREIAATMYERMDGKGSDEMTLIGAEAIKMLVVETIQMSEEGGISPKGAMELANALRAAAAAQVASSTRRQKLEAEEKAKQVQAEMEAKAERALDALSSEPGVSKEAIARARREFLGVRPKKQSAVPAVTPSESNADG